MKKQYLLLGAILLPLLSFAATYFVTNTNDSGTGSLRQAILDANANPGLDYIHFNISGTGPHIISPLTVLPCTEGAVVIDAYTQPGAAVATTSTAAVIKIELDGSLAPLPFPVDGSHFGLCLQGDAKVRGLAIHDFVSGILIVSGNSNMVQGNYIGLDASGTNAPGNLTDGLVINSSSNTIGGSTPADRNVVAGHPEEGAVIFPYTSGNVIQGNYFGTNASGNSLLPNVMNNIAVASSNNSILNNVLGGGGHGLYIARWDNIAPLPSNNTIRNNSIGIGANGSSSIPNTHGVTIYEAANNTIQNNLIAGNGWYGIEIVHASSIGNRLSQNRIYDNGFLGIDLGGDGVSPNDASDSDAGPNNLQNFPVITSAKISAGKLQVKGTLNTSNPAAASIELYANNVPSPAGDPSGHGEGKTYLGTAMVSPQGLFTANLSAVPVGTLITAIAIGAGNNTSEFAANVAATGSGNQALSNSTLAQAYPNPFHTSTLITWNHPVAGKVRLAIFSATGQEVAVLANDFRQAGPQQVVFRSTGLASGVYSYRLEVPDGVQSGKLVLQNE